MLDKLHIEFTKSRARRTNDNALAESKNASIVRKHLGYSHIPSRFAEAVNAFTRDTLTPYLNFHRPCFFAETTIDNKDRQRKKYKYKDINALYEKLKTLNNIKNILKPDLTIEDLDRAANAMTDSQAAQQLNQKRKHYLMLSSKQKPPDRILPFQAHFTIGMD